VATVREFLAELDEVFGFYLDAGIALYIARERLAAMKGMHGVDGDSSFMFKDGPPTGTPEQELEASIHATTLDALLDRMARNAVDELKAADATVVFAYHLWEEKYRRNLTSQDGKPLEELSSDIMGDLRLVRNSIIHNKGVASVETARCKVLTFIKPGHRIALDRDHMNFIIRRIKDEMNAYA
jgi:hypothetical protein